MNARVAAILVVLLAVLGGGALIYQQQERARRPSNVGSLGQVLLKDLKAADIASIRIAEGKEVLTLERKDERWTIAERGSFPADFQRVRDFVLKAIELKAGQTEPIGEKDRARLALDESGTTVEFRGADGKPLRALIVGKKYFKREVDNPAKALGDGRFVLLPADPKTVYIVGDPLVQATAKTSEWIDRGAFQVEKVRTLEVQAPRRRRLPHRAQRRQRRLEARRREARREARDHPGERRLLLAEPARPRRRAAEGHQGHRPRQADRDRRHHPRRPHLQHQGRQA